MGAVAVGQGHNKGRGRGTKHRLIRTGSVAFHNLLYPGPIAFDQVQTVEDIGNHHVPGLGGTTLNVLECQSLDQPAQGDKFHAVIVDVDNDTAGNAACENLAEKIPNNKVVMRLRPVKKDWNECLTAGIICFGFFNNF